MNSYVHIDCVLLCQAGLLISAAALVAKGTSQLDHCPYIVTLLNAARSTKDVNQHHQRQVGA